MARTGPATFRDRPKLEDRCFRLAPTTPPLRISNETPGALRRARRGRSRIEILLGPELAVAPVHGLDSCAVLRFRTLHDDQINDVVAPPIHDRRDRAPRGWQRPPPTVRN